MAVVDPAAEGHGAIGGDPTAGGHQREVGDQGRGRLVGRQRHPELSTSLQPVCDHTKTRRDQTATTTSSQTDRAHHPDGGDDGDPRRDDHQCQVGGQAHVDVVPKPKVALALVSEPPVGRDGRVRAEGWGVVAKDNGRAAVLINQGVHYWALEQFTHKDSAAVCVKIYDTKNEQYKSVYIASIYLDIKLDTISNDLKNLVEHCCRRRIPLIVGMDSNAHSTAWGALENNKRGEEL